MSYEFQSRRQSTEITFMKLSEQSSSEPLLVLGRTKMDLVSYHTYVITEADLG